MDEAHTGRARGEEHSSLPCGISSTNDDNLLPLADASLQLGGRIVDTCALQALLLRHSELAITRSGGDHHGTPEENGVVVQSDFVESRPCAALKLLRTARHRHPRTELDGLQLGPEGEVGARDAGWKSE